jgi:hypothetical protein
MRCPLKLKIFLLALLTTTSAYAKIGGPNIKYEKMSDSTAVFEEDDTETEFDVKDASITNVNLMVPTTKVFGGDLILLGSYWKDEMTIQYEGQDPDTLSFETLPLGGVWVEDSEENQWVGLYRSWVHPSGDFQAMHEFIVGRSVNADFLLFGSFNQNKAKLFLKVNKYPKYQAAVLIFQNRMTNGAGTFFDLDITNNGPSRAVFGQWLDNTKWEVGLNVNELNGQTEDGEGAWKRGWQGNIYGSYAHQVSGIVYANLSAGAKILNRSFNDVEEENESTYTQVGVPYVSLAVETWLDAPK